MVVLHDFLVLMYILARADQRVLLVINYTINLIAIFPIQVTVLALLFHNQNVLMYFSLLNYFV